MLNPNVVSFFQESKILDSHQKSPVSGVQRALLFQLKKLGISLNTVNYYFLHQFTVQKMRDTTIELDDKRNKIVLHCMALFGKESKKEAIEKIIEEFSKTKEFKEALIKDFQKNKMKNEKKYNKKKK